VLFAGAVRDAGCVPGPAVDRAAFPPAVELLVEFFPKIAASVVASSAAGLWFAAPLERPEALAPVPVDLAWPAFAPAAPPAAPAPAPPPALLPLVLFELPLVPKMSSRAVATPDAVLLFFAPAAAGWPCCVFAAGEGGALPEAFLAAFTAAAASAAAQACCAVSVQPVVGQFELTHYQRPSTAKFWIEQAEAKFSQFRFPAYEQMIFEVSLRDHPCLS
jgi:hypothetical protein